MFKTVVNVSLLSLVFASSLCWLPITAATQSQAAPRFTELSPRDMVRLDRQRALIAAALMQHYGLSLTHTAKDISALQRLVDDAVFSKSQSYELQSLGVAFGDVLVSALPLRWVMITDEYGTDPTLRYKKTMVNVNALTMVSKRIERGERVDLSHLLEITRAQLDDANKKLR